MAKLTYVEKLKDPRWQKKRLEILSRDNFTCQSCYDKTATLHLHHLDYISGNEPWEYPDEYLLTLCEKCHKKVTQERPLYEKELISQFRLKLKDTFIQGCAVDLFKGLSSDNLHSIIFMLWEINLKKNVSEIIFDLYNSLNEDMNKKIQEILSKKEVISGKD